ncbi:response regulator [Paenibacillus paeoniae]|nr:response regulator [Paenibacillus paeoniae]
MIVEDEIRILNSLVNNIPWERHGIEVVALAENGREALSIVERRMPDIVLLDIEMPEMDGLTLAETVLEREPQTKIIILSGHDDFHYAQRAIGLGVMKYLLKPAGEDEILQTVLEAAEEIRRELSEKHSLTELQRMWSSRLPQLQEEFLRSWITNRYAEWELRKHSGELNLQLQENGRYEVSVCEIDPLSEAEIRFSSADRALLQFSLESIAKECMPPEECRVFNDANGSTVLLFMSQPGESDDSLTKRMNGRISRLLNMVKECLKLTASAGMGTVCSLGEVPHSYQQACRALQERAVYGHEIAIPYLEVRRSEQPVFFDSSFERQLEMAIYTGEGVQASALIDSYVERAFDHADSSELAYEHVLYLSGVFTRMIQSQGWLMQKVLANDYAYFLSLETLVSKSHIVEWAKRVTGHIAAYLENERRSSSHQLVKKIVETVDQMLDDDLSLHSLAERMYVNSSYLSRLFKKETGESFSGYVLSRRMERAKELLLSEAKVYDAANAVGYRDLSYFAKVFRKYWGMAPSDLKK